MWRWTCPTGNVREPRIRMPVVPRECDPSRSGHISRASTVHNYLLYQPCSTYALRTAFSHIFPFFAPSELPQRRKIATAHSTSSQPTRAGPRLVRIVTWIPFVPSQPNVHAPSILALSAHSSGRAVTHKPPTWINSKLFTYVCRRCETCAQLPQSHTSTTVFWCLMLTNYLPG